MVGHDLTQEIQEKLKLNAPQEFNHAQLAFMRAKSGLFFSNLESLAEKQLLHNFPMVFDQEFVDQLVEDARLLSSRAAIFITEHNSVFFKDQDAIHTFLRRLECSDIRLIKMGCQEDQQNSRLFYFKQRTCYEEVFAEPLLGRLIAILNDKNSIDNEDIVKILSNFSLLAMDFLDFISAPLDAFRKEYASPNALYLCAMSGQFFGDRTIHCVERSAIYRGSKIFIKHPTMQRYFPEDNYIEELLVTQCLRLFHMCIVDAIKIIINDKQREGSKQQPLETLLEQAEQIRRLFFEIIENDQSFYTQIKELVRSAEPTLAISQYLHKRLTSLDALSRKELCQLKKSLNCVNSPEEYMKSLLTFYLNGKEKPRDGDISNLMELIAKRKARGDFLIKMLSGGFQPSVLTEQIKADLGEGYQKSYKRSPNPISFRKKNKVVPAKSCNEPGSGSTDEVGKKRGYEITADELAVGIFRTRIDEPSSKRPKSPVTTNVPREPTTPDREQTTPHREQATPHREQTTPPRAQIATPQKRAFTFFPPDIRRKLSFPEPLRPNEK